MVDEAQKILAFSEIMTTSEAMQYLRVSRKTLLKLVHEGKIPAQKVGKDFRYLKSEIDRFLRTSQSYFST